MYVCISSIIVNGFCDHNETVHIMFGNYTWEEIRAASDSIVSQACTNSQDGSVIRRCLVNGDNWGDIDYTACRNGRGIYYMYMHLTFISVVQPEPIVLTFYMRFSSNFSAIVSSGNPQSVLDNIRITVRPVVYWYSSCTFSHID